MGGGEDSGILLLTLGIDDVLMCGQYMINNLWCITGCTSTCISLNLLLETGVYNWKKGAFLPRAFYYKKIEFSPSNPTSKNHCKF